MGCKRKCDFGDSRQDEDDGSDENDRIVTEEENVIIEGINEEIDEANEVPIPEAVEDEEANLGDNGGRYISRLERRMEEIEDKSSVAYQKISWDVLKNKCSSLINKVSPTNIQVITSELLSVNLIRGRGLFCEAILKSQMFAPHYSHVFAGLAAAVNAIFPDVVHLLVKRIMVQFFEAYNEKERLMVIAKFFSELVNQQIIDVDVALEVLHFLMGGALRHHIEVGWELLMDCGYKVVGRSADGLNLVISSIYKFADCNSFQTADACIRAIESRRFRVHTLDWVNPEQEVTHSISIYDGLDIEEELNTFSPKNDFLENEEKYQDLRNNLGL